MKVLVLSPTLYDTAPAMRFRMEQWARHLVPKGFRFDFVPFEDEQLHRLLYQPGNYVQKGALVLGALVRRFACLRRVGAYDLVFLHREAAILGPAVIERLIVRQGVPVVYDFDDPIWMSYRSPTNSVFGRLRCPGKTAAICRLASRVFAGNRLLAGWAEQYSSRVDVVPSTVDMDRYPAAEPKAESTVTLGWTGSHSTLPFLETLLPVLRRLSKTHRFRLVVISHTNDYQIPDLEAEVIAKKWNAATESEDLRGIDIGLAPFPDSGWTPWRCHGKVLQYMASGIATVTSNLGVLPEYICEGENGFLANTEDEWVDRLSRLIENPALRFEMGMRGRETVAGRYSAQVWAPKVGKMLSDVVGREAKSRELEPAACTN
jgi:glycosyltransferase involved in cell wall biosynthesis